MTRHSSILVMPRGRTKPIRTAITRSSTRMTESRLDTYGYNDRSELTNAVKNATLNEYAYQYDDIGNRITALDLGTNHTYTANSLGEGGSRLPTEARFAKEDGEGGRSAQEDPRLIPRA